MGKDDSRPINYLALPTYLGTCYPSLESFSQENLEFLATCSEYLEQAPKLFRMLSGKTQGQYQEEWRKTFASVNVSEFKALSTSYSHDQEILFHERWCEKTYESLMQSNLWENFFEFIESQDNVELKRHYLELRRNWWRQAKLALYPSLAIYHLANDFLPALTNYFEFATLEFKKHKKSLDSDARYHTSFFLKRLATWITDFERVLCEAMMVRLRIASEHQEVTYDDVMISTVEELKHLGVLKEDTRYPKALHQLAPELFNYFQGYLGAHGTKSQREDFLSQVSWFSKKAGYATITHDQHLWVVPKTLAFLYPTSRLQKFLLNFRVGYRALTEEIRAEQHLFAQAQLADYWKLELYDEHLDTKLTPLLAYYQELTEAKCRIKIVKPQGVLGFLFRFQRRAWDALDEYHQQQQQKLVDKLLLALRGAVIEFETQISVHPTLDVTAAQAQAMQLIKEALVTLADAITPAQKETLAHLSERYDKVYQVSHPPKENPYQIYLDEIANGELKGQGHLKPLYDYVELLKKGDETVYRAFQREGSQALEGIYPFYESLLERLSHGQRLNEDESPYLARALVCLHTLGDETTHVYLKKALYTLYEHYLVKGTQSNQAFNWFTQCEGILLTHAQMINQREVLESVKQLHVVRTHQPENFQQTCTTYLEAFQNQERVQKAHLDAIAFECELWNKIKHLGFLQEAALQRLHSLVDEAVGKRCSMVELSLSASDKTLLGLYRSDQQPLLWLTKLIQLKQELHHLDYQEATQQENTVVRLSNLTHQMGLAHFGFFTSSKPSFTTLRAKTPESHLTKGQIL